MRPVRVLLIDDSPTDRDQIVEILSHDLPPIQLTEVTSHVQFFRALKGAAFDLVIASQRVHWSTGPEIASAVTSLLPMVPVIVTAVHHESDIAQASRASGAAAFLVKDDDLAEQLRSVIRAELQLVSEPPPRREEPTEPAVSAEVSSPSQVESSSESPNSLRGQPQSELSVPAEPQPPPVPERQQAAPPAHGSGKVPAQVTVPRPAPPVPPARSGRGRRPKEQDSNAHPSGRVQGTQQTAAGPVGPPAETAREGSGETELPVTSPVTQALFDGLGFGVFRMRLDGTVVSASVGFRLLTGVPEGGDLRAQYVDPAQHQRLLEQLERHTTVAGLQLVLRGQNDTERWLLLNATIRPVADELLIDGAVSDGTSLHRELDSVQRMSASFRTIVQCSSSATAVLDRDGVVVLANPAFATLVGVERDAVEGLFWPDLVIEEDSDAVVAVHRAVLDGSRENGALEAVLVDRSGGRHEVRLNERLLEGASRTVLSVTDLTRIRQAEQQVLHHAFHDGLTGLPNRLFLLDRLTDLLERQQQGGREFALILLDLDRFGIVNDGLGHLVGDQLLRAVGQRLEAAVDPSDTLTCLGGDRFGVVVELDGSADEVVAVASLLRSALTQPFQVAEHELHCTASMGIVTSRQGDSADTLLRNAGAAVERAHYEGRNRWALFSGEMSEDATRTFRIEQALRRALAGFELRLHLQPVFELESAAVAGFEALLRWQQSDGGLLEPAQFLAVAEDSGLIVPIGEWTIERACRHVMKWGRVAPQSQARIGVNLSFQQIANPNLIRTVEGALAATGADPSRVVLEVNQTALMRDPEHAEATVEALSALGVRLCLDGFGTGSSVLSHAHRFPFEMIKIDRSFLSGIGSDEVRWRVLEQIHGLARSLADRVVVQGVEHQEQLDRLRAFGCCLAQGRLLSVPLEPKDAERLLAAS